MFIPAGARLDGSGAQIGSGVDVHDYRRIRDGFLDVQYRAQASRPRRREREGALARGRRPRARRAGRERPRRRSWPSSGARGPTSPTTRAASPPASRSSSRPRPSPRRSPTSTASSPRSPSRPRRAQALTAYDPATGPYGTSRRSPTELETLGAAIRPAHTAGQQPQRPARRARHAARPALRRSATTTVVDLGDGGIRVLFGNTGDPLVDDRRRHRPATPASTGPRRSPPRAASSAGCSTCTRPAASSTATAPSSPRSPRASPPRSTTSTRRPVPGRLLHLRPGAARRRPLVAVTTATLQVGTPIDPPPAPARAGANDLALRIAALRGGATDDRYSALVARVGAEIDQTNLVRTNAEVLTNAVEDRRAVGLRRRRSTRR